MTKKKMWDNSNMQEEIHWGNIELPGVPDEVLLTKNWEKSEVMKQLRSTESWKNKIKESYSNLERNKKISEKQKEIFSDPKYLENHKKRQKELWKSDSFRSKMEEVYKERSLGDWKEKTIKSNNDRARNVITPDGEFESTGLAAKFYGITSVAMSTRIERHPDIYYFKDEGPKTPPIIDYRQRHAEGLKRRKDNPKWKEHCQRMRDKPKVKFQCPDGIFTADEACIFYKITRPTLYNRLKSDPTNWIKLGK